MLTANTVAQFCKLGDKQPWIQVEDLDAAFAESCDTGTGGRAVLEWSPVKPPQGEKVVYLGRSISGDEVVVTTITTHGGDHLSQLYSTAAHAYPGSNGALVVSGCGPAGLVSTTLSVPHRASNKSPACCEAQPNATDKKDALAQRGLVIPAFTITEALERYMATRSSWSVATISSSSSCLAFAAVRLVTLREARGRLFLPDTRDVALDHTHVAVTKVV